MNDQVEESVVEEADLVREAFDAAISQDKSEDEVKMALIGAGATFKSVTRLYTKYMIDAGFAVSKAEKDEIVGKILEGKSVAEEGDFSKAVAAIVKKAAGVTEKSGAALVRAWAKANEQEFWAKPKGTGGARDGFKSRFYEALIVNPTMSEAQCTEYLATAEGNSENIRRNENVYQGVRSMANNIHAAAKAAK